MASKEMVEKKTKKGEFSIKIGSTDRNNPRVIFFEGTTYVSPTFDCEDYTDIMNRIEHFSEKKVFETVKKIGNTFFQENFISSFDISAGRMKKDKYSCLQFEYYLIQPKGNSIFSVKDIIKEKIDKCCLLPFEELEKELKNNEFIVVNKKPKPAK